MACFVVPMTEAVVTTVAQRIMKAHEKEEKLSPEMDCAEGDVVDAFPFFLNSINHIMHRSIFHIQRHLHIL